MRPRGSNLTRRTHLPLKVSNPAAEVGEARVTSSIPLFSVPIFNLGPLASLPPPRSHTSMPEADSW